MALFEGCAGPLRLPESKERFELPAGPPLTPRGLGRCAREVVGSEMAFGTHVGPCRTLLGPAEDTVLASLVKGLLLERRVEGEPSPMLTCERRRNGEPDLSFGELGLSFGELGADEGMKPDMRSGDLARARGALGKMIFARPKLGELLPIGAADGPPNIRPRRPPSTGEPGIAPVEDPIPPNAAFEAREGTSSHSDGVRGRMEPLGPIVGTPIAGPVLSGRSFPPRSLPPDAFVAAPADGPPAVLD
eukprot:scaffold224224_cov28-Tisochrysis_lutea.AAC.7